MMKIHIDDYPYNKLSKQAATLQNLLIKLEIFQIIYFSPTKGYNISSSWNLLAFNDLRV